MRNLKRLRTQTRCIRIVEESAEFYKDIGTKLLSAELVKSISEVANADPRKAIILIYRKWIRTDKDHSWNNLAQGDTVKAVRLIYEQWLQKDEDHTWKKLIQCFRDVQLNSLARELELHFGLPSPSGS